MELERTSGEKWGQAIFGFAKFFLFDNSWGNFHVLIILKTSNEPLCETSTFREFPKSRNDGACLLVYGGVH